jgi:hypothetical protein
MRRENKELSLQQGKPLKAECNDEEEAQTCCVSSCAEKGGRQFMSENKHDRF